MKEFIQFLYIGNFYNLSSPIYYPQNIDTSVLKNSNLYLDIELKNDVVNNLAKSLNNQYPNSLNFIIYYGYGYNSVKISYIKGQKTLNSLTREELKAQL